MTKLKEIRKEKGITQEEMAKELGYSGKSGYSMLENGNVRMTLEQAIKIANKFKMSIEDIFLD